jgi:hypothetical protein
MGIIINNSNRQIWITANNKKYCLRPGETSDNAIPPNEGKDADGILLDGTPALFDSIRTDLGGGTTNREGAIKLRTPGTMTVTNVAGPAIVLKVEIDVLGLVPVPGTESAGYHDMAWCRRFPGWDIKSLSQNY